jgi:hypothetical protein
VGSPGEASGPTRSFERADQRYGSLADDPAEAPFTAIRARTVSASGGLAGRPQYGPGSPGGCVSYRRAIHVDQTEPGCSVLLDLRQGRGSAGVLVNQTWATRLSLSPYQTDITAYLRPGAIDAAAIIRGTVAGYPGSATPSPAVTGRERHGLLARSPNC